MFPAFIKITNPLSANSHTDVEKIAKKNNVAELITKGYDGVLQEKGYMMYTDSKGEDLYADQYIVFEKDNMMLLPNPIENNI